MTRTGTTRETLSEELKILRQRIAELEALEVTRHDDKKLLQPENEGIYKAVFESSNDSILLIDKKGKIIDFNERLTKISGYHKEELIGKNISSLAEKITKKSLATITSNFLIRTDGLHVSPYEVEMYKKNGELLSVEITAQPLKKDGKIIGDLVLLRDVTERKHAEDELRNKSSEIQLINSIYDAANRGLSLLEIIRLASKEIQQYYGGFAVVTYFLSDDKQYLLVQDISLPTKITRSVEKLIGMKISDVKIKLKPGGIYSEILKKGEVHIAEDPVMLQRMIKECTTDKALQKLAPAVIRIIGSRSLISIPLVNDNEGIGILDIARHEPLTDADKKQIQTIAGQLVNIIKRKQAEEALKESEEKYRLIVDNSHDVIFTLNSDGKFIYISPSIEKVLGYERTALIGRHFRSIVHPDDIGIIIEAIQRLFKDGYNTPGGIEFRANHISGEWRWLNASGSNAYDVHGNFLSFIGVVRDISKHKQVEEALKESEEKYRNVVELAKDGICIIQNKLIKYCNPQLAEMWGGTVAEVQNTPFSNYLHTESLTMVVERYNRRMADEQVPSKYEATLKHKDGRKIYVVINIGMLEYLGQGAEIAIIHDITERKQAAEALKESEENFRNSLDNSLVGIRISDIDNNTLYTNQALLDIFGYNNIDEVNAIHPQKYYTPDSYADYLKMREQFRRGEIMPDQVEIDIIRRDGIIRHLQALFKILLWNGKQQYQTLYHDITERKQAVSALKASEQNFRNSLDSSSLGINIIDTNFNVLYANQALLDIFGYENIDELKANPPSEHYTPDSYANWVLRHEKILRGEPVPNKIETDIVRKDGTIRHLEVFRKAVFWDGKQQFQTLYNDITDRKKAEMQIREQKAFTDRVLESTTEAVIVVGPDRRVIMVNKAFENTFLLSKSKVAGQEIGEIIPASRLVDSISQVLTSGKSQLQVEFRIRHVSVEKILIADIIGMQKNEVLALMRDITDEREMQERLYLTDRLASIGEMAAGIAHELNNPLTGVVALSQLLLETGVPNEMKEDLETIRKEGQRAASIVKNLLSFARSHTTSIQAIDINAVICEVLNLRAYEDKANNIEVITHLAPNLPEIMADRFQMQQVFLNIILNAEQSMTLSNVRGNLTVSTEPINGFVRISFADDGPGIPPEIMNRILDPFFTTKEVGKGTGLGLSICYGIVANQGGKIYARSRQGKGATFVVELPLNGH